MENITAKVSCFAQAYHTRNNTTHLFADTAAVSLLFVFPLTLAFIDLRYSATVVCIVATAAAIQEGFTVRDVHY